jgi:HD-GYP domain-containing protein (c-di-GMP phosphodiesterase class II)
MELSTILNSTLQQKKVLQRAMEAATRLMGTEVGSLLLVDEESQELVFEVALGEKGDKVKQIRLKPGEGIAGWVARTGEPLVVPDVAKDPRHYRRADQVSHFVTKNMICVPVKIKDRTIGVLQAINKLHDEAFAKEELSLFTGLANQVAIAIENARLYEELESTFLSTAEALAEAIEKRDPYTGGHTRRVREYCMAIARHLPLSPQEKRNLNWAATLHDIGKIGVRDAILRKKGKLTEKEFAAMKEHPRVGAEIMAHIKQLREVVGGIRSHQERNDGAGYPDGLRDGQIPMVARIIAVADTFDAITTDRPYRKKRTEEEAVEEIRRCAGSQFDRMVTEAFLKAHESGEIRRILKDNAA